MATTFAKRILFAGALVDVKICPSRDANVKEPETGPGALAEN